MSDTINIKRMRNRGRLVLGVFVLLGGALIARAVDLQVVRNEFLLAQGAARYLRVVEMPAHRGMIVDRNGEPLAVSTPVDSLWMNPRELAKVPEQLPALAKALEMSLADLRREVAAKADAGREFVYLQRRMNPAAAAMIMALKIPGVYSQREYRRYYPAGEVVAHVLGFTNIDDKGIAGLELEYNDWLRGMPGAKRVMKDRLGRFVETVESLSTPRPGQTLHASIDLRVQYLAYRELKAAVQQHGAKSGSIVVLDITSGEVLAMASQPSFNPNDRSEYEPDVTRNRAVTDVFEPGSSFKPFPIAAALESGRFNPHTPVNTAPGFLKVGNFAVRDSRNYGMIDVTTVLTKSVNSGASRIALALDPAQLWNVLADFGFGMLTGSGFPGERTGTLRHYSTWRDIGQATLAYGYGVSVTPLQLAQGYGVIASNGLRQPISFVVQPEPAAGQRVVSAHSARAMRRMLETVVSPQGTGRAAQVAGYQVAGKTGTARKAAGGGYAQDRHIAVFAGMAPASRPRLVTVVVLNEPRGHDYYGGEIAAPVFAEVMAGALRLLDIPPDDLPGEELPPAAPVVVAARGQP